MPVPYSLSLTVHFSSLAPTVVFSDSRVNQIRELNWQIPTEHCHGSADGACQPAPIFPQIQGHYQKDQQEPALGQEMTQAIAV